MRYWKAILLVVVLAGLVAHNVVLQRQVSQLKHVIRPARSAVSRGQPAPGVVREVQSKRVDADVPIGETVYVTRTGTKYHRAGCRHLGRSSIPMALGEATSQGYEPCRVCNP